MLTNEYNRLINLFLDLFAVTWGYFLQEKWDNSNSKKIYFQLQKLLTIRSYRQVDQMRPLAFGFRALAPNCSCMRESTNST